ncbi:MAG: hypothetical protein KC776_02350 [Myxococcales bacterium]|nr:hypothetical protein [Myxococcales bacterium]MCB9582428.1 hypothetical protein [Polyangiaceae bacterium]
MTSRSVLFALGVLLAGCGSTNADDPGSGGSAGTGGSAGAAGSGGAGGQSCEALKAAMKSWIDARTSCGPGSTCARIDPPLVPLNTDGLCNSAAVFDPSAAGELQSLADQWTAMDCKDTLDGQIIIACPSMPGHAECVDSKCAIVNDTPQCPDTLDPVCTQSGMNARNECYANEFLKDPPASPGFCPDTPQCTSQGGTCHTATDNGPRCADGTTFAPNSMTCAGGNFETSCCVPSGVNCTLVLRSMSLTMNPFTCQKIDSAPFSICLGADPTACDYQTQITQGAGSKPWNAAVTVHTSPGNQIEVSGTSTDLGRKFKCAGSISHDFAPDAIWQCDACDLNDQNCTTCAVPQHTYCDP